MRVEERISPNRDGRPPGALPTLVILHYTGMRTCAEAVARLCDRAARVSAHYVIDEDGLILRLVPDAMQAWHAGRSFWAGQAGLNATSIGIELVNPGHEWGYRPFPTAQIRVLEDLLRELLARWPIAPEAVLGHSDVAPARKQDPGELFPWRRLAAHGLALWPAASVPERPDAHRAAVRLRRIGYGLDEAGASLPTVLRAFQRRFRAEQVDGTLDATTMGRLRAVEALCGAPPAAS